MVAQYLRILYAHNVAYTLKKVDGLQRLAKSKQPEGQPGLLPASTQTYLVAQVCSDLYWFAEQPFQFNPDLPRTGFGKYLRYTFQNGLNSGSGFFYDDPSNTTNHYTGLKIL